MVFLDLNGVDVTAILNDDVDEVVMTIARASVGVDEITPLLRNLAAA